MEIVGWKIVLKHENGIDRVEITGVGEDPHKPEEILTTFRGRNGKAVLEKILEGVRKGVPVIVPALSDRDLYAYSYHAGRIADEDPRWKFESNLPEISISEEEDGEMLIT
ncbi:hypothetical protein [Geoglobus acetivorans]|uniref:Uncharacterized protein n=1 Tax=Geoglobus acetivorans TaxID=565033 RepID=A0ABZ3H4W3_GEOAI|nr:hypothetical protein [Geoglobus acetivorans]